MTQKQIERAKKALENFRWLKDRFNKPYIGVRTPIPNEWLSLAREFSSETATNETEAVVVLSILYIDSGGEYSETELWMLLEKTLL